MFSTLLRSGLLKTHMVWKVEEIPSTLCHELTVLIVIFYRAVRRLSKEDSNWRHVLTQIAVKDLTNSLC